MPLRRSATSARLRCPRDKHGHSCKTISTYLTKIKAAMRFAAKPHVITDAQGVEREVLLLATAPYIEDGEAAISKVTQLPRSKPRDFIPTDQQLATMIDALPEDEEHEVAFGYVVMALNTWARPEAITDLSVSPPGRFHGRHHRPQSARPAAEQEGPPHDPADG
jgi:hypothetical protein